MPFTPSPVRCLSIHASYRCRHAGACCEQDWHIPVEPAVVEVVRNSGLLAGREPGFVESGANGHPVVARHATSACVFFEPSAGRLCAIHRKAGSGALPSACRHFPRVVLHDDRGTFVNLSHFCPTAAALLLVPAPVEIVEAPGSLLVDDLHGFEARGALPPLLRPAMLCDLAGHSAWESEAIALLARGDRPPAEALGMLDAATRRSRAWTPVAGALDAWIRESFAVKGDAGANVSRPADQQRRVALLEPLSGTRLDGYGADPFTAWTAGRDLLEPWSAATGRYLAARVFASSLAYEAQGILTLVEWLHTCLAVLEREAARQAAGAAVLDQPAFLESVRRTDLVLVHQSDSRAFARRAARTVEGESR